MNTPCFLSESIAKVMATDTAASGELLHEWWVLARALESENNHLTEERAYHRSLKDRVDDGLRKHIEILKAQLEDARRSAGSIRAES